MTTPHPAKFSKQLIPVIARPLLPCKRILEPCGGTGKIAQIREHGFQGTIVSVDLQKKWVEQSTGCRTVVADSTRSPFRDESFDGAGTSYVFGNRMSDHHDAKDASDRNTYTHKHGEPLHPNNSGRMHFREQRFRDVNRGITREVFRLLVPGAPFVLDMKNFFEKWVLHETVFWHISMAIGEGFLLEDRIQVTCKGNRKGSRESRSQRVDCHDVLIFRKPLRGAAR